MTQVLKSARRVTVVSPHLDDAVLSIGATINSLVSQGVHVRVVTMFAGDPDSDLPASYWDTARGVATLGESARLRQAEDGAACQKLGAEPVWLPFADNGYTTIRDPDFIWKSLQSHIADVDVVILPGFPLSHSDHRYATLLTLEREEGNSAIVLYSEMPYAAEPKRLIQSIGRGRTIAPVRHAFGGPITWKRQPTSKVDRAARRSALACVRRRAQQSGTSWQVGTILCHGGERRVARVPST